MFLQLFEGRLGAVAEAHEVAVLALGLHLKEKASYVSYILIKNTWFLFFFARVIS